MRFELIQMGFPEQSVNRLLSLKKILSIEQAIDYFIKGDLGWNHDFEADPHNK